jgi:hypothetical protein
VKTSKMPPIAAATFVFLAIDRNLLFNGDGKKRTGFEWANFRRYIPRKEAFNVPNDVFSGASLDEFFPSTSKKKFTINFLWQVARPDFPSRRDTSAEISAVHTGRVGTPASRPRAPFVVAVKDQQGKLIGIDRSSSVGRFFAPQAPHPVSCRSVG